MPYQKTKDGSLVNEVTLGDGYPLSNDLQPLKVGGEASPIEMSKSLPDDSDNAKVKVRGDLETKGNLILNSNIKGNIVPTGYIELSGTASDTENNDKVRIGATTGLGSEILSIYSNSGYLYLGPQNTSFCHFYTDRNNFYFNRPIIVDGGVSASYDEDFVIRRDWNDTTYNQLTLGDDTFEIKLDNTSRLNIDSDGNVGIGTDSPNAALEVKTTGDTLCRLSTDGDAGDVAHLQLYRNSAAYAQFHYEADGGTNAGLHLTDFRDSENAHIIFNTRGDNERMRIESDGKVGIGTTSPTTTLDVEGTVSYKHTAFTTAGPTDNVDVSGTTVLEVDTSSNNVIIGGFTGGVQGQILYIVKTNTANFIQLEHNEGGGSQDIFLTTGSDERVVGYGGYTLYCNGTSWFSLSNPTGGADAG